MVSDDKGTPLAAATVSLKGTVKAVITDEQGRYSIEIDNSAAVLEFSSVGYITKGVNVGSGDELNIVLEAGSGKLEEEVVVTGFGENRAKGLWVIPLPKYQEMIYGARATLIP
ncbi:carboxypeptidase-like regulatory domain-containing protein [Niabella hibiscisoli]|uniref:carboxypeptidase-like regulatory domain-containing protein n=1 Tax=Niabella hibiscisoli TaxID=1825928 RepID=UPI001F118495|nr:carboxypeptidase-like regulatory domain-containing protein [Niabella hibiscisoli]MCH5718699.1 carboxypeptidase-like regulatory domain-containing protein [Niabella hibiscisoli]